MKSGHWKERTKLLIGEEALEQLRISHVLVAGLGGVGGYAAEALCRAGVGTISLVDNDVVADSNRNRQLLALDSTRGQHKADLMAKRLRDINPEVQLYLHSVYLKDDKIPEILSQQFDYVIDAIDTLSPKIFFIKHCMDHNLRLVSSMGAGGRLDPQQVRVGDVSESFGCPFAQVVRKKIHGWGIRTGFKVVFSPEKVVKSSVIVTDDSPNKKSTVGTISYMPAVFGLTAASVVIRELIAETL